MAVPRFKVGNHVKYNGDIYKIYDIKWYGLNFMYDVICVQNNFPDEFPATSLGMGAEDRMTLVDFYPPEKEKKCPYCNISDQEINSIDGKYLPNCGGDRDFSIVYQDWGDEGTTKHLLICDGRRGGYYRPKYCPECGRKLIIN